MVIYILRIGVIFVEGFISFFRDTLDGPLYVAVVVVNSILILLCLKYILAYYFNIGIRKHKTQAEMDDALLAAQALVPAGATIQSSGIVALPVDAFAQQAMPTAQPVVMTQGMPVMNSPVAQPSNVVIVQPNGMPVGQPVMQSPVVQPVMQSPVVQPIMQRPVVQPVMQPGVQNVVQPSNVVIVQPNGVPVAQNAGQTHPMIYHESMKRHKTGDYYGGTVSTSVQKKAIPINPNSRKKMSGSAFNPFK